MGDDPKKVRQRIVKNAKNHNLDKDYAKDTRNGRYGPGKNKCNVFIDDILDASGVYTSDPNGMGSGWGLGAPVTAGQWADPNYTVPGWQVVEFPQAGDIVAVKGNFSDASGHVAIMVSPTQSIGASQYEVHINDFGYSKSWLSHYPGNNGYIYRRYVGIPVVKMDFRNINLFSR